MAQCGRSTCLGPPGEAKRTSLIGSPSARKRSTFLLPLIPVVAFQHFYVQGDSVWGSTRNACITCWYQHRGLVLFISFCDCRNEDAVPSPLHGPQEVVRLLLGGIWGAGGTRYNQNQKSAPCGPKRGPCARGNYVEFFFRALPNRVIF